MTTSELSRVCAQKIVDRVASQPAPGMPGYRPPEDIAADLIEGAINRALEEAARGTEQRIVHTGGPGAVDVKVTKSTQGVSLEVDVKRPREDGETYEAAATASARVAVDAYRTALRELHPLGLVPGKEQKG